MSYSTCVDYIKKNAPRGLVSALLQTVSTAYEKCPSIHPTYYSMPDHLDIFYPEARIGEKTFEAHLHEYRRLSAVNLRNVTDALDSIAGLATGQALLKEIAGGRRAVHIVPYWHWDRVLLPGPVNAVPRPIKRNQPLNHLVDGLPRGSDLDTLAKGAVTYDCHAVTGTCTPMKDIGTGKGADVVLFYSPEMWGTKIDGLVFPGAKADEVLFHELVHVSRQFRGCQDPVPVGGDYGNHEEYLAITLANLYISEKGQNDLRGGLRKPAVCENGATICPANRHTRAQDYRAAVLNRPDQFYQNAGSASMPPRELMQRFSAAQNDFYLALARLPKDKPKFNPVRQHFREDGKIDI